MFFWVPGLLRVGSVRFGSPPKPGVVAGGLGSVRFSPAIVKGGIHRALFAFFNVFLYLVGLNS